VLLAAASVSNKLFYNRSKLDSSKIARAGRCVLPPGSRNSEKALNASIEGGRAGGWKVTSVAALEPSYFAAMQYERSRVNQSGRRGGHGRGFHDKNVWNSTMNYVTTDGIVRKRWNSDAEAYADHLLRLDATSRRNRLRGWRPERLRPPS